MHGAKRGDADAIGVYSTVQRTLIYVTRILWPNFSNYNLAQMSRTYSIVQYSAGVDSPV